MLLSDSLALGKQPGGPAPCQASGRLLSRDANKSRQVMKNWLLPTSHELKSPIVARPLAALGSASGQVAGLDFEEASSSLVLSYS